MRFKLRGQPFRLDFVPAQTMGKNRGDCGPPRTDGKTRRIRIATGQKPQDTLDTLLHEALHGLHWEHDEAFVAKSATELARLLWRLGYRREEDRASNDR